MINLISVKSKTKKRVGRGISAGGGKTAGRGTKGQKSRSGHNIPRRFEGGQTALSMRLPKLPGFKSVHKKAIVLRLDVISENFKDGEVVSNETLVEKGLIKKSDKVKVLNTGKLTVKVTLGDGVKVSKSIEALFAQKEKVDEAAKLQSSKVAEKETVVKKVTKTQSEKVSPKKTKTVKK